MTRRDIRLTHRTRLGTKEAKGWIPVDWVGIIDRMGATSSGRSVRAAGHFHASEPTPGEGIRAARIEATLTVEQLAQRVATVRAKKRLPETQLESLRRQLIGFESNDHKPGPQWRTLIAEALQVPQERVFGLQIAPTLPRPLLAETRVSDATVANLMNRRAIYAQTEHIFGPDHVYHHVAQDMLVVTDLIRAAPNPLRRDMRLAAASIAELAGWLAQDRGDNVQADAFTKEALAHVGLVEDADPAFRAMLFMRRSNILTRSDTATSVEYAAQAARIAAVLPTSRLHVSIARQQAVAALAAGDKAGFLEHAAYAFELADQQADVEPVLGDPAPYATPGYVASETTAGFIALGRADEAAEQLQSHLARWPDGQQRDYAVAALRLVHALVATGEYSAAVQISEDALAAWRATPSARARRELAVIAKLLANRNRSDQSLPLTELRRRIKDAHEGN